MVTTSQQKIVSALSAQTQFIRRKSLVVVTVVVVGDTAAGWLPQRERERERERERQPSQRTADQ